MGGNDGRRKDTIKIEGAVNEDVEGKFKDIIKSLS
jgi:hypothetical protein